MLAWQSNVLWALEWTLVIPVLPLLAYKTRALKILCLLQFMVVLGLAFVAANYTWGVAHWVLSGVIALCYLVHAVCIPLATMPSAHWKLVRALSCISACNFLTCHPLSHDTPESRSLIRGCKMLVHTGVITSIAILAVFYILVRPVHDAWGCYPPNAPFKDHNKGMCGTMPGKLANNWWSRHSSKESEICIAAVKKHPDCLPTITAVKAFGAPLMVGYQAAMAAGAAYIIGCILARESEVDAEPYACKPRPLSKTATRRGV